MSRKVLLRLAVVFAVIGIVVGYIYYRTSRTWQYEVVAEGTLYRCAARSIEEFGASEVITRPRSAMLIASRENLKAPPYAAITEYCYRTSTRTLLIEVPPDGKLTHDNIAQALSEIAKDKRWPVLAVSSDGVYSGQVAAAYRLAVMKLPLAEVEKLAQLPDAPSATTQAIRDFARNYDQALRRMDAGPATRETAPQGPPTPATAPH